MLREHMSAASPAHEVQKRSRPTELMEAGALVAAAVWTVLWGMGTRRLWSQAGYLHLAFAQSLAGDRGFGVQGKLVFGDASPLWIALLAGCHALLAGFHVLRGDGARDWLLAGKVLTAIAVVFFGAGLYRFTQALVAGRDASLRSLLPAIVVLVVWLSPFFGAEAFLGSEVLAAAGVACWGCALVAGPLTAAIRPTRLLMACLCAGCGPLLRPEMLFLSVCLAPFLFVRWVNTPLRFVPRIALFFGGLLLAVGPGAGWLLYTVRRFGTALPNTIGAGAAPPGVSVLGRGMARVGVGAPWLLLTLAGCAGWVAWFAVGWAGRRKGTVRGDVLSPMPGAELSKLDPAAWIPLVWAALTAVYYLALHSAITSREVMLLTPASTATIFVAASHFRPRLVRTMGIVCAVYGLAVSLLYFWRTLPVELRRDRVFADLAGTLGHLPPHQTVALTPVGEVLFLSGHPVADLGGTLDGSAAAFRWDATDARRVWWAHGQGARFLVLDHLPEPGSTAVWRANLPADPWESGHGASGTFDRLTLWRLPPSPTLPAPAAPLDSGG